MNRIQGQLSRPLCTKAPKQNEKYRKVHGPCATRTLQRTLPPTAGLPAIASDESCITSDHEHLLRTKALTRAADDEAAEDPSAGGRTPSCSDPGSSIAVGRRRTPKRRRTRPTHPATTHPDCPAHEKTRATKNSPGSSDSCTRSELVRPHLHVVVDSTEVMRRRDGDNHGRTLFHTDEAAAATSAISSET